MHVRAETQSNVMKYAQFGQIYNQPNLIFYANFLVEITINKTIKIFPTIFVSDMILNKWK